MGLYCFFGLGAVGKQQAVKNNTDRKKVKISTMLTEYKADCGHFFFFKKRTKRVLIEGAPKDD